MENINEVWLIIKPYFEDISIQSLIALIVCVFIKFALNRTADKTAARLDAKKMYTNAFNDSIGHIKDVAFTHDIQPIVNNTLIEMKESAVKVMSSEISKVNEEYVALIDIIQTFASFFDTSFAVSEEKKNLLASKITAGKAIIEDKSKVQSTVTITDTEKHKMKKDTKTDIDEPVVNITR